MDSIFAAPKCFKLLGSRRLRESTGPERNGPRPTPGLGETGSIPAADSLQRNLLEPAGLLPAYRG